MQHIPSLRQSFLFVIYGSDYKERLFFYFFFWLSIIEEKAENGNKHKTLVMNIEEFKGGKEEHKRMVCFDIDNPLRFLGLMPYFAKFVGQLVC